MKDSEDEPEDVRNARAVEEEIRRGEIDEISSKKMGAGSKHHRCRREEVATKTTDCCEAKKLKAAAQQKKTVTMYVFEEPCKLEKEEIIPRRCLTRDEYIDFLATPSKKCPSPCAKKATTRRIRAMPARIEELAKPTKHRLINTLETWGAILSNEKLDNLIGIVEAETALTPEQAENYLRDKNHEKKQKQQKKTKKTECSPKKKGKKNKMIVACDLELNEEAANCQYSMAMRFVRSILNWSCGTPRQEYSDIAQAILCRLSQVLDYCPVGPEDRKSQQMRLLADIFACWIAEILMQVSEQHRAELEAECQRRAREAEERAAREQLEAQLQAEEDAYAEDDDGTGTAGGASTAATSFAVNEEEELQDELGSDAEDGLDAIKLETATQYEEEDAGCGVDQQSQGCRSETEDSEPVVCEDECVDVEQQTEVVSKSCAETDTCSELEESCKSKEQLELEAIASRMSSVFATDVPFVTFAKILDTLYCMIECEADASLEDPMDNRIHRAIYEKFEKLIKRESPELLTERLKDVVDVSSGKLARWLRRTLNEQQIKFLCDQPAEVESREMRNWSKWIMEVADLGLDWSSWVERITNEGNSMKCKVGKITRSDWQNWTSNFESDALRLRRAHLETRHQEHHNIVMLTDRQPVKTGCMKKPLYVETTIKNTNFESDSRVCHK